MWCYWLQRWTQMKSHWLVGNSRALFIQSCSGHLTFVQLIDTSYGLRCIPFQMFLWVDKQYKTGPHWLSLYFSNHFHLLLCSTEQPIWNNKRISLFCGWTPCQDGIKGKNILKCILIKTWFSRYIAKTELCLTNVYKNWTEVAITTMRLSHFSFFSELSL